MAAHVEEAVGYVDPGSSSSVAMVLIGLSRFRRVKGGSRVGLDAVFVGYSRYTRASHKNHVLRYDNSHALEFSRHCESSTLPR